jgi:hypothetical protein
MTISVPEIMDDSFYSYFVFLGRGVSLTLNTCCASLGNLFLLASNLRHAKLGAICLRSSVHISANIAEIPLCKDA